MNERVPFAQQYTETDYILIASSGHIETIVVFSLKFPIKSYILLHYISQRNDNSFEKFDAAKLYLLLFRVCVISKSKTFRL